jgi:magnesium-transporting ATPase (P-type)
MKGFAKMVPDAAVVLRGGEKVRVEAAELVVGDVIEVKGGDKIPADIPHRLSRRPQSRQLVADRRVRGAAAHGGTERRTTTHSRRRTSHSSRRLRQKAWRPASWCSTGDRTVIGRIAQLVMHTKNVETPLVKEINRFIRKLISAMASWRSASFS